MSQANFSNDLTVVTVNGRQITAWGQAANPYTDDPIDQRSTLVRGQASASMRLDRTNPGRRVTLSIMPGTPDAAFLKGLFNSGANITLSRQQIGTLEVAVGTEGVMINDGPVGRGGGTAVTDDQFIIEFNIWNASSGGE